MTPRRRFALVCSALGFVITTVCLHRTTPLTMLAFFNLALPLYALGILVYLYDIAVIAIRLRRGGNP